ncbi:hemolysin family protein [Blautia sp.]|uniref:hemolysin family protein n=1 Tax=Blautia sp. TaxID=1955243 RepID=UPI002E771A3A|nr:hemolysin family protein [Blautia sp.]MEE0811710.1 hemolysin family protein [Blautia sp.]
MIGSMILLIVLILLNAVFASAEIAVISMNEAKLQALTQAGNKKALKLTKLTQQPARFLATIQVAITLAGFLSSAFAADYFSDPLVSALLNAGVPVPETVLNSASVLVITIVLSYFSLVFGELVPKRIAMKKSESLALSLAGLLYAVSRIASPLVALLTASTNGVLRLLGIDPEESGEEVTEEEIRMMLSQGSQQGTIEKEETEMIQNVFDFNDISAEQICTHRMDVLSLDADDSLDNWKDVIFQSRHSFYPVYQNTIDNIIGILDAKDYFRTKAATKEELLHHASDTPWFVPENMKANILFQKMRETRQYFAVLVDEYGGMSGIVTLHDLMETLVGDLYEEDEENPQPEIQKLSEDTWKILGSTPLEEVSEAMGIPLPTENYDTYSGFICDIIGRIPKHGETFSCQSHGLDIQVHSVLNHRIGETTVRKLHEASDAAEEEKLHSFV